MVKKFVLHVKDNMTKKEHILNNMEDLISNFLYYDRKEDEELPRGFIEDAIFNGEITIEDIVEKFLKERGIRSCQALKPNPHYRQLGIDGNLQIRKFLGIIYK